MTVSEPADIASGRGVTYEWESFLVEVLERLATVEQAGGGSGSVAGTGASYQHVQSSPASTWSINHELGTMPVVAVVSNAGALLFAEVSYPDTDNIVITFGQPYAGSAYLRG